MNPAIGNQEAILGRFNSGVGGKLRKVDRNLRTPPFGDKRFTAHCFKLVRAILTDRNWRIQRRRREQRHFRRTVEHLSEQPSAVTTIPGIARPTEPFVDHKLSHFLSPHRRLAPWRRPDHFDQGPAHKGGIWLHRDRAHWVFLTDRENI